VLAKSNILIVSTAADFSLELFYKSECQKLINPVTINYNASDEEVETLLKYDFDFVYFRDPFNDNSINQKTARANTDKILKHYQSAYKVDGISKYEDMLFEDKWTQYQLFKELMPETRLLRSLDIAPGTFVKKRISARTKGIIFQNSDFYSNATPEDYLVQSKLEIDAEYRVFLVGGEIVMPLAQKTSKKSKESKVKLVRTETNLPLEMKEICETVYKRTNFDFIGLDIACTKGRYCLLEANRSPQFKGYSRLTQQNLAKTLENHLLTKN
jgi:hypothetical protein